MGQCYQCFGECGIVFDCQDQVFGVLLVIVVVGYVGYCSDWCCRGCSVCGCGWQYGWCCWWCCYGDFGSDGCVCRGCFLQWQFQDEVVVVFGFIVDLDVVVYVFGQVV